MSTAALFTTAPIGEQPGCHSIDNWVKTGKHRQQQQQQQTTTGGTCTEWDATRPGKVSPFVTTWVDLEGVILRNTGQTEKGKYHMTSLVCGISRKNNKTDTD